MAWIYLFVASLFEVCWAISLKYSNGLKNIFPTAVTIIAMLLSFVFLSMAAKELPIGTAYSVWTGIGVIGTVLLGILLFNEPANLSRFVFILFILIGIIGLKFNLFSK